MAENELELALHHRLFKKYHPHMMKFLTIYTN
jgi:hypothetical protein